VAAKFVVNLHTLQTRYQTCISRTQGQVRKFTYKYKYKYKYKYLRATFKYSSSTTSLITYVVNLKLGHNGNVQHNLKASKKTVKNMHIVCFLYTTKSSLGNNYVVASTSRPTTNVHDTTQNLQHCLALTESEIKEKNKTNR